MIYMMYLNTDTFKKHQKLCIRAWFSKQVFRVNMGKKYDFNKKQYYKYGFHYFKGVTHIGEGRYFRPYTNMFKIRGNLNV